MTSNALVAACLAGAATMAAVAPARADFTVCNKTESRVGVAVGHQEEEEWLTEGWWTLFPGECKPILEFPLTQRLYRIFALDWDKGGSWGGAIAMCTQTKVFTIKGAENCADRGFDTSGFFEIDTGAEETWTVQLTEPDEQ